MWFLIVIVVILIFILIVIPMEIFVNHEQLRLEGKKSLKDLLAHLHITESRGIALAVNNEVIPRKSWAAHSLHEQDRITLIRASQGG